MDNLFENKKDEQLKVYFNQFQEWERTGVIPDNELGEMRDAYFDKLGVGWHTVCMIDLLRTIAFRWEKNIYCETKLSG